MAKVRRRTWTNKEGIQSQSWIIDYVDCFGKRRRDSGFKTKAEAQKALAKAVTEVDNGIGLRKNKTITFAMAAEKFLNLHASIHCKKSTYTFYKQSLDKHLLPFFEDIKLIDITPNRINEFIQFKIQEGYSPKSINHHITLLGSVIQKMVDDGVILQNPVQKIKRLKLSHKEMKFLTPKEIHIVLDTAKKHYEDFCPLLATAILTGMRKGELLALTWDKINWQIRKININVAIYRGVLSTPKTERSIRRIDMSSELVKILKYWKLKCTTSKNDIVFPNSTGGYLDQDNIIKRRFEPILRKAGVEKIRFHDLRHTYAALLISKNVPIKYIQAQMGHSSIQVTLDNYGHLMPELTQRGIDALDSLFSEQNRIENKYNLSNV